ncbi:hypothetical protein C8Q80DRAFT_1190615 [Daedaleopsis nitida]|nr:hypothetical protein C8Q80DRAFT_1190615 [Daedaleopsis nitida]
MCGRFALGLSQEDIQAMHGYNVQIGEWVGQDQFVPRYNVAPRSNAPVIRRRDDNQGSSSSGSGSSGPSASQPGASTTSSNFDPQAGGPKSATTGTASSEQGRRSQEPDLRDTSSTQTGPPLMLHTMRWGIVPHYVKHEDPTLKTINARCEALIEEPRGMWASIKGRKRCAVVCQGYYEWLKKGKERLPHFTKHADGRLMLLAGLWDCVVLEGNSEPLWTFTIVTTSASKGLSWLHDRQPVILPDEAALTAWLDTSSGKWSPQLDKLCDPYEPLTCYQVPKEVGKVGIESPIFIEPIAERKDGIQAMFARQSRPKRSLSPHKDDAPLEKKPKVEKLNTWEDDSNIEYIDVDADDDTDTSPQSSNASLKSSTGTQTPNKKSAPRPDTKSSKSSPRKTISTKRHSDKSAKITSFFSKS